MQILPSTRRCAFISFIAGAVLATVAMAQNTDNSNENEETVVDLPPYVVNEDSGGRYIGSNSLSATGAAIPVAEMPFSISVLTRELLDDAATFQVMDLNKFVSGMGTYNRPYSDSGGQTLRGFSATVATDGAQTQFDSVTRDMANVARVEVLKGPSAILFPRAGSAGGTINVVTKTPQEKRGGYIKGQVGQYNSNRIELDYNGEPLLGGKLLYRVVMSAQDTDGYSEVDFLKRFIIYPALTYKFSEDSSITFKYQWWDQQNTVPTGQALGPTGDNDPANPFFDFSLPRRRSFDDPDLNNAQLKEHRTWLTFNSKLNDAVALRAGFQSADTDNFRLFTRPTGGRPIIAADGTLNRFVAGPHWYRYDYRAFVDSTAVFTVAGTNHTLLYGAEHTVQGGSMQDNWDAPIQPTNVFAPPPSGSVNNMVFVPAVPAGGFDLTKVYIMDLIKLWGERVILTGGITRNWFHGTSYNGSYNSSAVFTGTNTFNHTKDTQNAKQYGVMVRAVDGVHVYASYNENYLATSSFLGIVQPDGSVIRGPRAPNRFNTGEEIGVKLNLLGDRLTVTASHYEIRLTNRTQNMLGTSFQEFIGDGISSGYELDVFYAPTNNLSLLATVAKLKTQNVNNTTRFNDVPETTATAWVRYDFSAGSLKGFGIAGGFTYCDEMENVNRGTRFTYDGRTLVDVALYYDWKPFKFQLNVQNLFNKDYYAGGSPPSISFRGPQRNVHATIVYSF